jgi:hypothetical protein
MDAISQKVQKILNLLGFVGPALLIPLKLLVMRVLLGVGLWDGGIPSIGGGGMFLRHRLCRCL